jgi:chromate transport protein ChrA
MKTLALNPSPDLYVNELGFQIVVFIVTKGIWLFLGIVIIFLILDKFRKRKIIKRLIELIQFFGIAIVLVSVLYIVRSGLSSLDMFLTLFIYPITGLSWSLDAQIVTPIILVFMGTSLLIEHTLWRRALMVLTIVAWVILGFIILTTSIT